MHNITANGSNALAESQALSDYFPEIYEPFPIVEHVTDLLTRKEECVVILTGHAGDGKSTVAVDILKTLRGISPDTVLSSPLKEREHIAENNVNIVKDMSELTKAQRGQWLTEAFQKSGSWLIVSNTGPLLSSLLDYAQEETKNIESDLLEALNQPLEIETTSQHRVEGLEKPLVIINLTRLDNVHLGAKLITKLVSHSGWNSCNTCSANGSCPIKKNRDILADDLEAVETRVRWIYARLTAYEHRLTLRQILAHISFSITGGKRCDEVSSAITSQEVEHEALQDILFSERFFGLRAGRPCEDANSLHAISVIRKNDYGASVGVDFDRQLNSTSGMDWANLPDGLTGIANLWRERSKEAKATRWRSALRRMYYFFGQVRQEFVNPAGLYFNNFLHSYGVRDFDHWKTSKEFDLKKSDRKKLGDICVNVLLERFTGFSANQFPSTAGLYLTLRRKDHNIVQPTQLVIDTLQFRDFEVDYDVVTRIPTLSYKKGLAILPLSLPLYDYIQARSVGELGTSLSPIYQSQIDWFQSELLRVTQVDRDDEDDEISMLKAGINGEVSIHNFLIDSELGVLEIVL